MAQIWHERAHILCYVFLYSTTCIYIYLYPHLDLIDNAHSTLYTQNQKTYVQT